LNSRVGECIVTGQVGIKMGQTLYEELGGEGKLRQIIDTFIDRVFEDRMIGFFSARPTRAGSKRWSSS